MFAELMGGFAALANPETFLYLVGGFLMGLVFGAIPGLTATLAIAPAARAVTCRDIDHEGNAYVICEVDPAHEDLRLFRTDENGNAYGHFGPLKADLASKGKDLVFAMNAGMYHEDRSPVGYYLEDGREEMRVISGPSQGNFGLLPNGIFCIGEGWARVIETRDFLARRPRCRHATQSGPMLVIEGALHPRFLPDSYSRYIRNGVGTSANGDRAVFAISQNTVTFHEFARLFRQREGVKDKSDDRQPGNQENRVVNVQTERTDLRFNVVLPDFVIGIDQVRDAFRLRYALIV